MEDTRDHAMPPAHGQQQDGRERSYRMKKNLLVALMGKKEEEHREFLQELFAKQIKKGSRFRPVPMESAASTQGSGKGGETLEVFHIWEKQESDLPPLPNVLPQVVVCSLPAGEKGASWLRFFKGNDYYMLLVCLDATSASVAIHFDPSTYLKTQETCQTAARLLAAGHPGEMRKQVRKNLKDFILGWYFNRIKRRERL